MSCLELPPGCLELLGEVLKLFSASPGLMHGGIIYLFIYWGPGPQGDRRHRAFGLSYRRMIFEIPFWNVFWSLFGILSGSLFAPNPSPWEHFCHSIFKIIFDLVSDRLLKQFWRCFHSSVGRIFRSLCECPQTPKMHTVLSIKMILHLQELPFYLDCRSPSWSLSLT